MIIIFKSTIFCILQLKTKRRHYVHKQPILRIFNRNKLWRFSNVLPDDEARLKLDAVQLESRLISLKSATLAISEYKNFAVFSHLSTCGGGSRKSVSGRSRFTPPQEAPNGSLLLQDNILYFQFSFAQNGRNTHEGFLIFTKTHYIWLTESVRFPYILDITPGKSCYLPENLFKTERNNLFTFSGLDLLLKRYVIRTRDHIPGISGRCFSESPTASGHGRKTIGCSG